MPSKDSLPILSHALDQLGDLLIHVREDGLQRPSPCSDWTVGDLVDHVVSAPGRFATMVRGEQPDWSATPDHLTDGWAAAFRSAADDLLHLLHQDEASGAVDPDWQTAEFAVHSWDLAHALGRGTDGLDPAVAERGLAFMKANLGEDVRGEAFGPEQPAPADGDAYDVLAAFAGRTVRA